MPPKVQFTREQIIESALKISIKSGISSLTVRKLAAELGCSVAPIYVNFKNTEALTSALMEKIGFMSWQYSTRAYTDIGFFNIGIGQILFVKDYPQLFLDLLTFNHKCFSMPDEMEKQMVDIMMKDKMLEGLDREQNRDLLQKMSVFTNGLSITMLNKQNELTLEKALKLLDETAHQLIYSQKNGFQDNYTPYGPIKLP